MQCSHTALRNHAVNAAWNTGMDTWAAARKIEESVFESIDSKGFGTGFASAREVLESGEGDCSEHAILAAAVSRSLGIPSRLVVGVMHHRGAFAYHMWHEVWTGDGWYALDATIGDGSADAARIKLADSSLPNGSVGEITSAITRAVGRLGVSIVEYTIDGTTTIVDQ